MANIGRGMTSAMDPNRLKSRYRSKFSHQSTQRTTYHWLMVAVLVTFPSLTATRAIALSQLKMSHPVVSDTSDTKARPSESRLPDSAPSVAQSASDDLPQLVPGTVPQETLQPNPMSPSSTPSSSPSNPTDPRFPTVRMGDRATPLRLPSVFPYVLGTGDVITLDVFDVPEFSGVDYVIGVDGTINVPWVGSVYLEGLTLEGASNYIEDVYSVYLTDPLIVVSLIQPRPLRISVVGEVSRPGSYTIDPVGGVPGDLGGDGISQWTTAIQAIQQAGSLTQMADIRNIEIQRGQILPGEESVISVDLWEFLQTGSLAQDITLRDGDTVVVPTAPELTPDEILEVATANFSPEFITTYVVGEVENPGTLELPPNATLNQALLAAGGYENDRAGRVELIRVNQDGSVERRRVSADFDDPVNDETNPPLRQNDILFVRRSTIAGISDVLDLVTAPIRNVFGLFNTTIDLIDRLDPDDDVNDDNDINNNGIPDDEELRDLAN
jgi:polysaccharide export outer membrane protein